MWFKLAGIFGLVLITLGVLLKRKRRADIFYAAGGSLLLVYSLSIGDWVFITLQVVFVAAALFDLQKAR